MVTKAKGACAARRASELPERGPARASSIRAAPHAASSNPQSEPLFDKRVPGLFLDALVPLEAAIASAKLGAPYCAMREAMIVPDEKRQELSRAAQAVIEKHRFLFTHHKDAIEFTVVMAAMNAAKFDHVLSVVGQQDAHLAAGASPGPSDERKKRPSSEHACSMREVLVGALMVLAPMALLALVLIVQHLRRN